jgi:hypothetical protein
MDATEVVAALLDEQKIGPDFIAACKLSEDAFLHGWNTRELLTGNQVHRSTYLRDMINAPPIHTFPDNLGASPLIPSRDDKQAFSGSQSCFHQALCPASHLGAQPLTLFFCISGIRWWDPLYSFLLSSSSLARWLFL